MNYLKNDFYIFVVFFSEIFKICFDIFFQFFDVRSYFCVVVFYDVW